MTARTAVRSWCALSLLAAAAPARADALPRETLAAVKRATAFVKVEAGGRSFSGSGFVARVEGKTAYLVTNQHVVEPDANPRGPFGPFGPRDPFAVLRRVARPGPAAVTAVFDPGLATERSAKAEVVALDADRDLAVARVELAGPPAALDTSAAGEADETTPVFVFGFPFGGALAVGKGHPAVTVNRGAVSSLRRDDAGAVKYVQVDADVNPGNSGGPVVDARGRVVGVAVARVRDSGIGLAVPVAAVRDIMSGRLADCKLTAGAGRVAAEGTLHDPAGVVRSAAVHYVLLDKKAPDPRPGPGGLAAAAGAKELSLTRDGPRLAGAASLPADAPAGTTVAWQASYVGADGRTVRLGVRRQPVAPPPAPPPAVKLTAADVDRLLPGLTGGDRIARLKSLHELGRAELVADRRADVARALEAVLGCDDILARHGAGEALARWHTPETVPAVLKLIGHKDDLIGHSALDVLAKLKDPRAAAPLAAEMVRARSPWRISRALEAIGPAAEPAVLGVLDGADRDGKVAVCNWLRRAGTPASLEALGRLEQSDDPYLAVSARAAANAVRARR